jgi:hypothetical protein
MEIARSFAGGECGEYSNIALPATADRCSCLLQRLQTTKLSQSMRSLALLHSPHDMTCKHLIMNWYRSLSLDQVEYPAQVEIMA